MFRKSLRFALGLAVTGALAVGSAASLPSAPPASCHLRSQILQLGRSGPGARTYVEELCGSRVVWKHQDH